jgi:hypothetical protein
MEDIMNNRIRVFKYAMSQLITSIEGDKFLGKGSIYRKRFIRCLLIYTKDRFDNCLSESDKFHFKKYMKGFLTEDDKKLAECVYNVIALDESFLFDIEDVTIDDIMQDLNKRQPNFRF